MEQNRSLRNNTTHLFTGTIADNIRFGKLDATDDEVIAAAKIANADKFIRRMPRGYNTVLTSDGANLVRICDFCCSNNLVISGV